MLQTSNHLGLFNYQWRACWYSMKNMPYILAHSANTSHDSVVGMFSMLPRSGSPLGPGGMLGVFLDTKRQRTTRKRIPRPTSSAGRAGMCIFFGDGDVYWGNINAGDLHILIGHPSWPWEYLIPIDCEHGTKKNAQGRSFSDSLLGPALVSLLFSATSSTVTNSRCRGRQWLMPTLNMWEVASWPHPTLNTSYRREDTVEVFGGHMHDNVTLLFRFQK